MPLKLSRTERNILQGPIGARANVPRTKDQDGDAKRRVESTFFTTKLACSAMTQTSAQKIEGRRQTQEYIMVGECKAW